MRTGRHFHPLVLWTAAVLLTVVVLSAALSPFIPIGSAKESSTNKRTKVSHALRERLNNIQSNTQTVSVILQLTQKPKGALKALLSQNGVKIKGEFDAFSSIAVDLPPDVMDQLESFDEVRVVSPDQEVKYLGFVEGTTGARDMRARSGNSGLKGKDMNIA